MIDKELIAKARVLEKVLREVTEGNERTIWEGFVLERTSQLEGPLFASWKITGKTNGRPVPPELGMTYMSEDEAQRAVLKYLGKLPL